MKQLLENGDSLNDIMEMDLMYYMHLMASDNEPKQEKSLHGAFGG